MHATLVSDLVVLVRRAALGPDRSIAAAPWLGGTSASRAALFELEELARRVRAFGATDEELSLSIGVLLATSSAAAGAP